MTVDPQPPANVSRTKRDPQEVTERLDAPMAALGVIFLLVVIGEGLARPGSSLKTSLIVAGWAIWALFVAEYLFKLYWAPDRTEFLRRSWWQLLFLILPFLRLLRVAMLIRAARAGRVVSSVVRASRSARGTLTARIGWLGAITAITVLGSSQLLFEFGDGTSYGDALHDAAFAAITGEPIRENSGFARILELLLAAYSVVVFAALAGSLGAYYLQPDRRAPGQVPSRGSGYRHL